MVTEKEGINHDTADTDWMVPNNKRLFYSTAFSGKPDLFRIAIKMILNLPLVLRILPDFTR